jgi:glycolate oxidase iron-sulfur subunit
MHSIVDNARISSERIRGIADQCVKCGLCLPSCPTYQLHKSESESPRGRIAMAHALTRDAHITADTHAHLSSCLACGICESVCPSQVPYQELIAGVRARIGADRRETIRRRAARYLLEHPHWLSWLLPAARAFYRPLRVFDANRSKPTAVMQIERAPAAASVAKLALLSGCTGAALEARVLNAAEDLLQRCGLAVQRLPSQCCGALAHHSGDAATGQRLGSMLQQQLNASGARASTGVVTGCAQHCANLAKASAPYRDPMELLWANRSKLCFRPDARVVALHLPCTQRCNPASVTATQSLLALVPGLTLLTLPHRGRCCGAAGTYALDHPDAAKGLQRPILEDLAQSGAQLLLSANIGCRLQLSDGCTLPVMHPLEFLHSLVESRP